MQQSDLPGIDDMNQYLWDGRPMPPAPPIDGAICVHVDRVIGPCGKAVATDRNHGWLCDEHASVIEHYYSAKHGMAS